MLFRSNPIAIDSSNNLLVNQTSYNYNNTAGFGFSGSGGYAYFTRSGGYALLVNCITSASNLVAFNYNGSGVGSISTNGSSTTYNTSSDYRLKTNVQPMTGALNKASNVRTVIGNYKTDDNSSRKPMLIAQDFLTALPEAVTEGKYFDPIDPDDIKKIPNSYDRYTLSYTDTIPLLFAAIKELKEKLETAEAKIEELQNK